MIAGLNNSRALRTSAVFWSVVMLAFALLSATGLTSKADALPYNVWTCDDELNLPGPVWNHWGGSATARTNDCPIGLNVASSETTQFGVRFDWVINGNGSTISRVRMRISGGDSTAATGVKYSLAPCALCDSFRQLPERTPSSMPLDVEYAVPDAKALAIRVECVQETCSPGRDLMVNRIRLLAHDDVDPEALEPTSSIMFSTNPEYVNWVKPTVVDQSTQILDRESGVASGALRMDEGTSDQRLLWQAQEECDLGFTDQSGTQTIFQRLDLCPGYDGDVGLIDLRNTKEGLHKLTVEATDGVGNQDQSAPVYFGVDRTPPPAPLNLRFGPGSQVTKYGWTADPAFDLFWDDVSLMPEMQTGAPKAWDSFGMRALPSGAKQPSRNILDNHSGPTAFPHEGLWELAVKTVDSTGSEGDRSPITIGYDSDVPAPPSPIISPWITLDRLHSGYAQDWLPPDPQPELDSKVCGYRFAVDDVEDNIPSPVIDVEVPATRATVPSGVGVGRHLVHLRSISCAGVPSETVNAPLNVDGAAPEMRLYGAPDGTWSRKPLNLSITASDVLSGVGDVEYKLDDGAATKVIASSAALTVGDGSHKLAMRATDVAGNTGDWVEKPVRVDQTAPAARFEARDPSNPRRVVATVDDIVSGIDNAWIEYRRVDGAADAGDMQWRTLGAPVQATASELKHMQIVRDLPDAQLEDGMYEMQIVSKDIAGNVGIGGAPPFGQALPVSLPMRAKTDLTALIASVARKCVTSAGRACKSADCKSKSKCSKKDVVVRSGAAAVRARDYDGRSALIGELRDAGGEPIANAALDVFSTEQYAARTFLKTVSTDADGNYMTLIPRGATRTFSVEFAGTNGRLPATRTAKLGVRAGVSLKISSTRVKPGQRVTFSGKLATGPAWLPSIGKSVQIQFVRNGKWVPTVGDAITNQNGRYSIPWNWGAVAQPTSFFFRAVVAPVPLWPFEKGTSPVVRVNARP